MSTLEPGAKVASLARGSLTVSKAREMQVVRSQVNAFEADGTVALDTLRHRDELIVNQRRAMRGKRIEDEVVHVLDEEVVWGGALADHYGHFLVETVARLWPLVHGDELEGLPTVFTVPPKQPSAADAPFASEWLDAFGARKIELPARGAVRCTKMLVPEPAWRLSAWIAPEIRDIHLQARQGLSVPASPSNEVLWLSRRGLDRIRTAYDEALFEWLLDAHIKTVDMATMTLAEQVGALEGPRAVTGVMGSAFHTLLMASEAPACLYLCPPWVKSAYVAQHRFLAGEVDFVPVLTPLWTRQARQRGIGFPFGYRLLIPEALRALSTTLLPGLLEDSRMEAFSQPEKHGPRRGSERREDDIDVAVAAVLRDPLSNDARMRLGTIFETKGLTRCALEQYFMVADLTDDCAQAPLCAARLLARDGQVDEASVMARRALEIDPGLSEAADYVNGSGETFASSLLAI